jgi:hypothetical protein
VIVRRLLMVFFAAVGSLFLAGGCAPLVPGTTDGRDSTKSTQNQAASVVPSLMWKTSSHDPASARVELTGVDPIALAVLGNPAITGDEWSSFLAIRVVPETKQAPQSDLPPLLGSYTATREGVRFEPRFRLEPGLRFRAEFDPVQMHAVAQKHLLLCGCSRADWEIKFTTKVTAEFSPQRQRPSSRATVVEVFPTASVLPENLLRFYIHFSAPMSRGEAYARIHLFDSKGRAVSDPFLELGEELWSNDGTRFTLLFDPGRIKRGLKPREEVGPVLETGKAYTLVIDRDWIDANGDPLQSGFGKSFRAGPADDTSPDPRNWSIKPPGADTTTALEVRFPEALDRALLDRLISVIDAEGRRVVGTITIQGGETIWMFTPHDPWRAGNYRLSVLSDLEDVAGNSVARPFEVDTTGPITARAANDSVTLSFRIGPPAR